MLIIVEHGDVEAGLEPLLDLEALRRLDVLEVDAAERRRDPLHEVDHLVGRAGIDAHGKPVDAAELLEQQRLALHHRHCRLGPDVAQAEHRRAVADDRDGVLADRVAMREGRVVMDRHADAGDAGGVGHRQVVAVVDRRH